MTEKNNINEAEHLKVVENGESTPFQSNLEPAAGIPLVHEYELPQEAVPYPIGHAMEFCLKNCHIVQCSKASKGYDLNLIRQKCKFPIHCSIGSVQGKL